MSSRRAFGERDSLTNFAAAITVMIPTGRLMRKIGLQLRPKTFALTSSPPSTFPEKEDVPITVPNKPNAFALSFCGKVTCMIASTCGNNSDAEMPWSTRAAMRKTGEGASPHSIEAAVNAPTPHMNIRLRP